MCIALSVLTAVTILAQDIVRWGEEDRDSLPGMKQSQFEQCSLLRWSNHLTKKK